MLTQYVAVREIGSTFFSTELVILAAVIVTFTGPSLGYAVAHRLGDRLLAAWGAVAVAIHLALPLGLRALVGGLAGRGLGGGTIAATVLAGSLLLCGFYAVFLPRQARDAASLEASYAAELGGALAALAVVLVSPSWRLTLAAYWLAAAFVAHLALGRRAVTALVLGAAGALVAAQPALDRAAARVYYRGYHGVAAPRVVETVYSSYQRIDVVDGAAGRALFLDGMPAFRAGDAEAGPGAGAGLGPVLLADLPAALHGRGGRALVIGAGSLATAALLRARGYEVTVVELDAELVRVALARFAGAHGLRPGDVRLVVDDGRRFLAAAAETWDLIVLDVPAPVHVKTALLYTPGFYRLVASRLAPGGVAAIGLFDGLGGQVGAAIAASAVRAFPDVAVVESRAARRALLYAGRPLPFSPADVGAAARGRDAGAKVVEAAAVRAAVAGVAPLSEARLAVVLALARAELEEAFW